MVEQPLVNPEVMVFMDDVIEALSLKDYRKPIAKQVFRNLLGRAYMTGREVTTMTGVARKLNELVKDCEKDSD